MITLHLFRERTRWLRGPDKALGRDPRVPGGARGDAAGGPLRVLRAPRLHGGQHRDAKAPASLQKYYLILWFQRDATYNCDYKLPR